MKLLVDFFPILLFFAAFKVWGVYVATGVAIAAALVQIIWMAMRKHRIDPMLWVSTAIIVVLGGLTIWLHDETFIKWKPTVLYWLMGGALLAGQLVFRKNLLKALMGAQLELPDAVWRVMNWSWVAFFAAMGAINLWVAFNFDTNTWVNYKLFGGMGLMILFILAQAVYLGRYVKTGEAGE
ncbi:MAG TPA: septation protein A [Ramlibacter sp.]